MATNLSTHNPITMWETISGNTELTQNPPQAAGQTFLRGTPVSLNTSGFSQAWDGSTLTGARGSIYGVSQESGGNYATAGESAPANFGQIGPPWSNFNIGAPPNQPAAVTIPYGAPFITGGTLTIVAVQDTLFLAQYDTAEGTTTITAAAVSSAGVLSATASNTHVVGEQVVLSGFTGNGLPLNGLTAIVLTVTSGTSYTAQLSSNPGTIATAGAGSDNPTYAPTQGLVGLQFGLTIDANGSWYIDPLKSPASSNAVLTVVALYPGDILQTNPFVGVPNGQLIFQFIATAVNI